jgi:hypothetical protein
MRRPITIEVTFLDATGTGPSGAEGIVRGADGTLHPFSGWLQLLAALELIAGRAAPAAGRSDAHTDHIQEDR